MKENYNNNKKMRIVFGITVVIVAFVVLADANPAMDKGDNSVREKLII